jgi:hypothetical protein
MKSRQLANVLIKIAGLYICLLAIPSCVAGIIVALNHPQTDTAFVEVMRIGAYAIGAGVQAVFGIVIIAMSRKIAGWMFKEDE